MSAATPAKKPNNQLDQAAAIGKELATQNQTFDITRYVNTETFKNEVARVLPKHLTSDRFARITLTCIRKTPKLAKCTQESLLGCLMQLSQFGLEPDGRRAYLIPFENRKAGTVECTLIVSYMGLAELVMRSGLVSTIHADVVREGDVFEYSMGVLTDHVPWFLRRDGGKPKEAGEIYAIYATVLNKDGTRLAVVMSVDEIERIRNMSRGKDQDPWRLHWNEMGKKSCFRRLSKWLVLSAEVREASEVEDEDDVIETSARQVKPQRIADIVSAANAELPDDRRLVEEQEPPNEDSYQSTDPEPEVRDAEESKPTKSRKSKTLIGTDPPDPTMFKTCCDFVDELTMNPNNKMQFIGDAGGFMEYSLPNGQSLHFGDGIKNEGGVDTLRPDAKEAIEAIVTRATQQAERRS